MFYDCLMIELVVYLSVLLVLSVLYLFFSLVIDMFVGVLVVCSGDDLESWFEFDIVDVDVMYFEMFGIEVFCGRVFEL